MTEITNHEYKWMQMDIVMGKVSETNRILMAKDAGRFPVWSTRGLYQSNVTPFRHVMGHKVMTVGWSKLSKMAVRVRPWVKAGCGLCGKPKRKPYLVCPNLPFELKNMRIKTHSSHQKVVSMSKKLCLCLFLVLLCLWFLKNFSAIAIKERSPLEDPELRREMQVAPHGQKCERGRGRHWRIPAMPLTYPIIIKHPSLREIIGHQGWTSPWMI